MIEELKCQPPRHHRPLLHQAGDRRRAAEVVVRDKAIEGDEGVAEALVLLDITDDVAEDELVAQSKGAR